MSSIVLYSPQRPSRQHWWLSLHIGIHLLFGVLQFALLPTDPVAITLRAALLTTLFVHLFWLTMLADMVDDPLPSRQMVLQAVPVRVEQSEHDFWYQWHNLE
jgi:hypothetical protein